MVENGFVYAVEKANKKKEKQKAAKLPQKEKAYETIKKIQNKYDFSFGYMSKDDASKLTDRERSQYYKAIKVTTNYSDQVLASLGLC